MVMAYFQAGIPTRWDAWESQEIQASNNEFLAALHQKNSSKEILGVYKEHHLLGNVEKS